MPDLRRMPRGRRSRVPRPVPPTGIQVAYYAELKRMLAYAAQLVRDRLISRLPEFVDRAAATMHADAAQPPGKRVNKILDQVSESFFKKYPQERMEKIAEKVAKATSERQKDFLIRQIKAMAGVDLSAVADRKLVPRVKQFTAENVSLIKTLPQSYFDDIEKRTLAGMREGLRHEEIAEQLEERLGVAESRAKLIARDQTLKFYGELNKVRQTQLGIGRYVWRTVHDNRVRSSHEERDGQTYSWDDPPGDPDDPADGGHPGEAINCRCFAEPVLDDLLGEDADS